MIMCPLRLSTLILLFFFSLNHSLTSSLRVSRLILPASNAELRITPHIAFPSSLTNSVDSGIHLKLPITIKFPSMIDLLEPVKEILKQHDDDDRIKRSRLLRKDRKEFDAKVLNVVRSKSRVSFYEFLSAYNSTLSLNCLLKTICQVGQVPLISPSLGLFGEIIDHLMR